MSIGIKAGMEIVLVGRYAIEITVEQKGIDWRARAIARADGDIVNIVERDYYYGSATAYELREQMLECVGYFLDDDYCYAWESADADRTEAMDCDPWNEWRNDNA